MPLEPVTKRKANWERVRVCATTTLIYVDYAPNPYEAELVEQAFRLPDPRATGKVLP